MINKRQLSDEDSYEFSSKHAKRLESVEDLAPDTGILPSHNDHQMSTSEDVGSLNFSKCQDETKSFDVNYKELETGVSGSISQFWWVNDNIIEAGMRLEAAPRLSLFPEYFEPGHHLRALFQSDEVCTSPVDYPLQKLVPVGPPYQAYVPEWDPQILNSSNCLVELDLEAKHLHESGVMVDVDQEKMMGTCLAPMPYLKASPKYLLEDRKNKSDCRCLDVGSIRCVTQHIMEARDQLRENLGEKLFENLGFHEMGEEVAKQWSEEEEHTFHEVLRTNPASHGKNFWHHLSLAFPSRTHKNLVSYYFNVFMLRKRAEQNRCDPLNIDSDDDEWQTNELELPDFSRHYAGDSLYCNASAYHYEDNRSEHSHKDIEYASVVDACKDGTSVVWRVGTNDEDGANMDNRVGAYVENSLGDFHDNFELSGENPSSENDDHGIRDASCSLVKICGEGSRKRDSKDCTIS